MKKAPLTARKITIMLLDKIFPILEVLLLPLTYISSKWLGVIRRQILTGKFRLSNHIFKKTGVFPIIDHYYEPIFNYAKYVTDWNKERLSGTINLNIPEQLTFIKSFNYGHELLRIPEKRIYTNDYFYKNKNFEAGDAEYYYSLIRKIKPSKIIEIGSGNSTLMALKAIEQNKLDQIENQTELICIEPYPNYWLKEIKGITLIKSKVEKLELTVFKELKENDILFIDSSHMIRPEGDVLFEFMEILKCIPSGVYIHIHDIFTPYLFPKDWIEKGNYLWNEQFLLEAILAYSSSFKVIGSLYYLKMNYLTEISHAFPNLAKHNNNPGSFWIYKI